MTLCSCIFVAGSSSPSSGDACHDEYRRRSGSGYVLDAFWSAWDAFAGADSYRSAIERAIPYGHNTDTTAAITGGLAGGCFGLDSIPAEWLGGMRGRNVVAPLLDRLIEDAGWRTSTVHPARVDFVDLSSVPGSPALRVASV